MTRRASAFMEETKAPNRRLERVSFFPEWTEQSLCAGMEDTFFFGSSDPGVRPQYTLADIKRARMLCVGCPVLRDCLTTSLQNKDEYGVFAGSTKNDRKKMLKRIETLITTVAEEVEAHYEFMLEVTRDRRIRAD